MHDIEPYWNWRDKYRSELDGKSPFYGREYSEFTYSDKIYNYYIHPQWDYIGSETLYVKLLYVNYKQQACIIEMIGEWNDSINNDIAFLKRDVIDTLITNGINKFILIGENILNFFGDENDYYEEWYDDIKDTDGWIVALNFRAHVLEDMKNSYIHYCININERYSNISWRNYKPNNLIKYIDDLLIKLIA